MLHLNLSLAGRSGIKLFLEIKIINAIHIYSSQVSRNNSTPTSSITWSEDENLQVLSCFIQSPTWSWLCWCLKSQGTLVPCHLSLPEAKSLHNQYYTLYELDICAFSEYIALQKKSILKEWKAVWWSKMTPKYQMCYLWIITISDSTVINVVGELKYPSRKLFVKHIEHKNPLFP